MSSPLLTVEYDSSTFEALVLVQGWQIRQLPVVHNGLLTGILTYPDLARSHKKIIETQNEATNRPVTIAVPVERAKPSDQFPVNVGLDLFM